MPINGYFHIVKVKFLSEFLFDRKVDQDINRIFLCNLLKFFNNVLYQTSKCEICYAKIK